MQGAGVSENGSRNAYGAELPDRRGICQRHQVDYKNAEQVVKYFKKMYDTIQEDRKEIYQETWIQNQVDEIATLFAETLYLLSLK